MWLCQLGEYIIRKPRKSESNAEVSSISSINSRLVTHVSEDEEGGGWVGAEQYDYGPFRANVEQRK